MKLEKITSYATSAGKYAAIGAAAMLMGCSSDAGMSLKLVDVQMGHQGAMYRKTDDRIQSDVVLFNTDAQPYNKSTITDQGLNASLWRHYNNRKQQQE